MFYKRVIYIWNVCVFKCTEHIFFSNVIIKTMTFYKSPCSEMFNEIVIFLINWDHNLLKRCNMHVGVLTLISIIITCVLGRLYYTLPQVQMGKDHLLDLRRCAKNPRKDIILQSVWLISIYKVFPLEWYCKLYFYSIQHASVILFLYVSFDLLWCL